MEDNFICPRRNAKAVVFILYFALFRALSRANLLWLHHWQLKLIKFQFKKDFAELKNVFGKLKFWKFIRLQKSYRGSIEIFE